MNRSGYRDPTAERAVEQVMREQKKTRKMMELVDTIEMMTSSDYKERFKAEYYQLRIRYTKLKKMVDTWEHLSFKPTCSRHLFCMQLEAMRSYLTIMKHRALAEGIELNEII